MLPGHELYVQGLEVVRYSLILELSGDDTDDFVQTIPEGDAIQTTHLTDAFVSLENFFTSIHSIGTDLVFVNAVRRTERLGSTIVAFDVLLAVAAQSWNVAGGLLLGSCDSVATHF